MGNTPTHWQHGGSPAPVGDPWAPPPPAVPPRPTRRGRIAVLAAAVAVLVLGAGAVVAWRVIGGDSGVAGAAGRPAAPPQGSDLPSAGGPSAVPTTATPGRSGPSALADEFDGTALDTAWWGIYASTSPNGSIWSRDAVRVEGGSLRITGTGRNPTGSGNVAGGVCWCGTGGNQQSGVWTVRARFDAGSGYGPGLLLWPQSDRASDGFATFASVTEGDRRTVRSLIMWGTAGQKAEAKLTGDFSQWHVYRVEWRPGSLRMLVDDAVLFDSKTRPGTVVPSKPMHLVMQMMVGPKDGVPAANASTPDTVAMEIDWVRYTP